MKSKAAAVREDELPTLRIRPVTALEPSTRNVSATRRISNVEQRARELDALHSGGEIALDIELSDVDIVEERPQSAFPLVRKASARRRLPAVASKVARGDR